MNYLLVNIWGNFVIPYEDAIKITALLQNARTVEGYGATRTLKRAEFEVRPVDDLEVQALEQAPLYGSTPDALFTALKAKADTPKFTLDDLK